jgi:hypothetical protein
VGPVAMKTSIVTLVLRGKVDRLRDFIKGDEFVKNNQEILLALRIAIQQKNVEIVKLFDEVFNLDIKDKRTVSLAAESSLEIWEIFASKPSVLKVPYCKNTHPLTVAFRAGNYDVARWLKRWADEGGGVSTEYKVHALYEAAEQGHVNVCKLYTVSEKYMAVVIKSLVKNGHADKVVEFVKNPHTDFSYNNFEMLTTCAAYFNAMCAILRHPSVQSKINDLPDYYKKANEACRTDWDIRKKVHMDVLTKRMADRIQVLEDQGMSRPTAVETAKLEFAKTIKKHLCEYDLDFFTYKFDV